VEVAVFGQFLKHRGLISDHDLETGLAGQKQSGLPLGEELVSRGVIPAEELNVLLAEFLSHKADELIGDDELWA
jgi:hypothetical protein